MSKTTEALMGKDLAIAAARQIIEYPETWEQSLPPYFSKAGGCGCFLHWVCVFHFGTERPRILNERDSREVLMPILGTSLQQNCQLFRATNTLEDLKSKIKEIFGIKQIKLSNGKIVKF